MKKCICLMVVMTALTSMALAEEPQWYVSSDKIAIIETQTKVTSLSFTDGRDIVGTLSWDDGVFKFSGNPDESAKILLDFIQRNADLYCKERKP